MTRARLFAWTAAMVACGAVVPRGAEILGMQVAGGAWNALRLTSPYLAQAGAIAGGLIGGALVGSVQWVCVPRGPLRRWLLPAAAAGLFLGFAYSIYHPLVVIAAPVAGALAALVELRDPRWVRAQSLAAAWVALALLLPFPWWADAIFLVGAALLSAWGIRFAFPLGR